MPKFVIGINLYKQLQEIDPIMAERLHPNDIRKIKRSLQVKQKPQL